MTMNMKLLFVPLVLGINLCLPPMTGAAGDKLGSALRAPAGIKSNVLPPRTPQSLTGADLVIGPGVQMTLTGGVTLTVGGDFLNAGAFSADTGTSVIFDGAGAQMLSGPTTFGNLEKSGADTLTLTSSVTVSKSLADIGGYVATGPYTISFGPGGTLNGAPAGGSVVGPNVVIGPAFATVILSLLDSWNMVSVPVLTNDFRKVDVFPAAVSAAFGYESGYAVKDTLVIGRGYWLKFSGVQNVPLNGSAVAHDTIAVARGWNLIGSITTPLPVASILSVGTTIASNVFGYNGSYVVVDTVEPGKGYWVKTDSAGQLIMAAGSQNHPAIQPVSKELALMNTLELTDASGARATLYFGAKPDPAFDLERYELPPVPPEGTFDARFGTQRMAETFSGEQSSDVPISLSSPSYPVKISWIIRGAQTPAVLLLDGKEIALTGSGSLTVADGKSRIALGAPRSENIPREFALRQNYPNPFNPSTEIRYDLPTDARVTIRILDLLGQEVRTLVDGVESAGYKTIRWDASGVASGTYFCRIEATGVSDAGRRFTQVRKMLLLR